MQNKAKYLNEQMNVTAFITRGYENKSRFLPPEKQSQTNPNKAKFKKAKMNVTTFLAKDYENKPNWTLGENEPKTNPIKANLVHLRRIQKGHLCLPALRVAGCPAERCSEPALNIVEGTSALGMTKMGPRFRGDDSNEYRISNKE